MKTSRQISFRAALALGWALVLAAFPAQASQKVGGINVDSASGIEIELSSDFNNFAPCNAAPFHVQIKNHTRQDGTWRFTFDASRYNNGGLRFETELKVEAGQSRTFQIVVPIDGDNSGTWVQIAADGPGVWSGRATISHSREGAGPYPQSIAMSGDLSSRSWGLLKKHFADAKKGFSGTEFDARALPENWRGFSGFEWVALSEGEWARLSPAVRSAIRQWVGTGGHLMVAVASRKLAGDASGMVSPALALFGEFRVGSGAGPFSYGFGDVRIIPWDGKEVDALKLAPLLEKGTPLAARLDQAGSKDWPMLTSLGQWRASSALVLIMVIGLAVVIGPVNLFYLAPAGRRHRLFFTTPLLSLGGSVLLLGLIFLQDKTGGTGHRFALLRLLPGAHEAVLLQEQVSRTGLLVSGDFTLDEEALLQPVPIERRGGRENLRFAVAGRDYSGSWFRSRTFQIQRLAAVRPTRAALTKVGTDPSGAPQVVSSFQSPLERVALTTGDGALWEGENLRTGQRVTLKPARQADILRWWKEATEGARGESAYFLSKPENQPGFRSTAAAATSHFYAILAVPTGEKNKEVIATLPSIRWSGDRVAVIGPLENGENAKGAEPSAQGGNNPNNPNDPNDP